MKSVARVLLVVCAGVVAVSGADARSRSSGGAFKAAALRQCRIDRHDGKPMTSDCKQLFDGLPHHHKAA